MKNIYKVFFLLCLFLVIGCESEADKRMKEEKEKVKKEWEKWEMLGSTSDGFIYYDKTSIKKVTWHGHSSREFIWQIMPKELKPSKRYYALVDCENPRFITLPLDLYKEKKELLDYSGKGAPIYENMVIAKIYEDVCYKY